ncbi:MAG: nucleoside monophosphate kinase [Verrucomicrobiae bacterium]|nr:nucleoside monophosphate kinase [Verrucomicrobiae bacterium]
MEAQPTGKRRRIVLLGGPGSGKGTAAAWLAKKLAVPHLSTGDMLRAEIAAGSDLGREAAASTASGRLVSDDLVLRLVAAHLGKDAAPGFVFDGFPRTVAQAESLDRLLHERASRLDLVLHLDVPLAAVEERIVGRLGCPSCGRVYHATRMPPKKDGVCDVCGAALQKRKDDNLEVLRERWKVYGEWGPRLVAYYRRHGGFAEMDADVTAEELYAKVWEATTA